MKPSKSIVTFRTCVAPEGDYRVRTLDLDVRKKVPVSSVERTTRGRGLDFFGMEHHFVTMPGEGAVRITWLEYQERGQWRPAAPEIDIGDQYASMVLGMDLLQRLGRIVLRRIDRPNCNLSDAAFADPSTVIDALQSSRWLEIERHEVRRGTYWVESENAHIGDEEAVA